MHACGEILLMNVWSLESGVFFFFFGALFPFFGIEIFAKLAQKKKEKIVEFTLEK
jgi:hypothetical protein